MKVGDTFPVQVAGMGVNVNARVTYIEDGKATLEIPAARVVFATRTTLSDEGPQADPNAKDQLIGSPGEKEESAVVTEKPAAEVVPAEDALRENATVDEPVERKSTEVEPKEESTSTEGPVEPPKESNE